MTATSTKITSSPTETKITTARDPRTFWRVGVALALPLGPLLVTLARAIMPYWTSQDDATIAANIAAHPKAMELMIWLGLPILPFMLITVLGLGYVARRGAPVLAAVGTIPAFFAYAMWNTAGPSDYLGWVMSTHGYSVDQMVTLSRQLGETPMAAIVGLFWVVVHILGMVVVAIALLRARMLPLWAAILLALSQPIHLTAAIILPSRWLDVVGGWGVTTLICGYLALRVLRMRNEDWDLPRLTSEEISPTR
jgi:hypothetical protein